MTGTTSDLRRQAIGSRSNFSTAPPDEDTMSKTGPTVPRRDRSSKHDPFQPAERDIVRAILDWLAAEGILAWRQNTGAMTGNHKGKSWYVRFGVPGQADITGILPDGRRLEIEVKRPGCWVSDSQRAFLARITAQGGVAFCAHSVEEAQAELVSRSQR